MRDASGRDALALDMPVARYDWRPRRHSGEALPWAGGGANTRGRQRRPCCSPTCCKGCGGTAKTGGAGRLRSVCTQRPREGGGGRGRSRKSTSADTAADAHRQQGSHGSSAPYTSRDSRLRRGPAQARARHTTALRRSLPRGPSTGVAPIREAGEGVPAVRPPAVKGAEAPRGPEARVGPVICDHPSGV